MPVTAPAKIETAFSKQWTGSLKKFGFTQISNLFLEQYSTLDPIITHSEAMFIVHLMQFKWSAASPFPSYQRLAKRMGVTEVSVKRYARSLEKKGYIQRSKRTGNTNQFHLTGLLTCLDGIANHESMPEKPTRHLVPMNISQTMPQPLENP